MSNLLLALALAFAGYRLFRLASVSIEAVRLLWRNAKIQMDADQERRQPRGE